jgi:hypothetical protein
MQTERTIDRSFDQTAVHVHSGTDKCPSCHWTEGHSSACDDNTPAERRVSPAVLEQRIINLSGDLNRMTTRAIAAERERDVALSRIIGFERITATLADALKTLDITVDPRPIPAMDLERSCQHVPFND